MCMYNSVAGSALAGAALIRHLHICCLRPVNRLPRGRPFSCLSLRILIGKRQKIPAITVFSQLTAMLPQ